MTTTFHPYLLAYIGVILVGLVVPCVCLADEVQLRPGGHYSARGPGCAPAEVSAARLKFKNLYDKKAFSQARETIELLLDACEIDLKYVDAAWIRNDLAITSYRLGDFSACMSTLEPLAKVAATYEGLDIADARPNLQKLVPVMQATLANLKLCGARTQR